MTGEIKFNHLLSFFILAVVFAGMIYLNGFQSFRDGVIDKLQGDKKTLDSIVIVKIDDESIVKIGRWPWDRDVFAELIEKTKEADVIGVDVSFFEKSENDLLLNKSLMDSQNVILASEINFGSVYKPIFQTKTGYVNLQTDRDGITRSVDSRLSEELIPFSFLIYQEAWGGDKELESKKYLIGFADSPGSFKSYSAYDVLRENYSFQDKIVLIGATAPNLHDTFFVPTSNGIAMSGVEIHANIIQNLILGDFIKKQKGFSIFIISILFGAVGLFIISKLKGYYLIPVILFSIIGYILVGVYLFTKDYAIDFFFAPFSLLLFTGIGIGINYLEEKKHNRFISDAFEKYVSKELLQELISKRHGLSLGGTKREISIFFSDIRGFTSISEKMNPEELVSFINEYLTAMTKIILEHKGTVDKFIGDAVMAFWNAPLDEKKHAYLSCKSAVAQINVLNELKKRWADRKLPEINIGCGINTGEAVIGNMGSEQRFDYTAIGDSVNLASRLEGLTKQYGVSIIVSENTYKKVKNKFVFRKLDKVKVKGKKIPIFIYELCVGADMKFNDAFELALNVYFNGKFKEAKRLFEKASSIKDDKSCHLFIERCDEYIKNRPVKGWDGSFEMNTK